MMQYFHVQILRHIIHPLLEVSLALANCFFIGQEVGHKLISFLIHHTSVLRKHKR